MSLELQIIKNGALERNLYLEPGEYIVGRDQASDIVLADKTVSGKHAALSVSDKTVQVRDLGSTNGTLIKGKRIKEKNLKGDFSFDIGAYTLRGAFKGAAVSAKGGFSALPPRFVVYTVLVALIMVAGLFFYVPLQDALKDFQKREALKRGILLSRYLSEINEYPMQLKMLDQVRVVPVSEEDGVVYAYVVDGYGKVLAPAQGMGRFLELPHVNDALELAELKTWTGPDGERIIFCPIYHGDKLLGGALLGYDMKRAVEAVGGGSGGKASLLFILMLALAFLSGWYILRVFKRPLRQLAEEVGICLKERRDHLQLKGSYKELQALVEAYERLLYLVVSRPVDRESKPRDPESKNPPRDPEPPQPRPVPVAEEPVSPPASPRKEMEPRQVEEPEPPVAAAVEFGPVAEPAPVAVDETVAHCVIDLERYVLLSANATFMSRFIEGQESVADMHMIVVFQDPDMINAISNMAEDPAPNASQKVTSQQGENITVTKAPAPGHAKAALFTFSV